MKYAWLLPVVCLLLCPLDAAAQSGAPAALAPPGSYSIDVADLQDQMERELLARRPTEFAFIARVCAFTQAGQLPLGTVRSTFYWARPKRPRPFEFFHRAMRIRAAEFGVQL